MAQALERGPPGILRRSPRSLFRAHRPRISLAVALGVDGVRRRPLYLVGRPWRIISARTRGEPLVQAPSRAPVLGARGNRLPLSSASLASLAAGLRRALPLRRPLLQGRSPEHSDRAREAPAVELQLLLSPRGREGGDSCRLLLGL